MARIIKVYKESLPPLRLIGKRYTNSDRGPDGGFSNVWDRWFENGDFKVLEQLDVGAEGSEGSEVDDLQSYVAYMRFVDNTFEYWVGMLFPEGTPVPDGYMYVDVRAADIGTCWIHGRDDTGELYGAEASQMCLAEIKKAGWQRAEDGWFFERYHLSRFTTPDEEGKVILDFGFELA